MRIHHTALCSLMIVSWSQLTQSFQSSKLPSAPSRLILYRDSRKFCHDNGDTASPTRKRSNPWIFSSRRELLSTLAAFAALVPRTGLAEELTVYQTASGLKYIDLEPGTGPSPSYGQLVSIQYSAYVKLPASSKDSNPKPELFEKQNAYLIKHGNGRTIAGLDEGLHTMKVGGKRRLLIPPKLGYVDSGLGPVPEYPWDRLKLNRLLDQMVKVKGGTVVFEVRLLSAMDDEADQGYYQDDSPSPEEFAALQQNLQQKMAASRAQQQQQQQTEETVVKSSES